MFLAVFLIVLFLIEIMEDTEDSSVDRRSNLTQNADDPMIMQNSDNPGVLVIVLLTYSNFLTWSKSVKKALAAKNKLEFINGGIVEPMEEPSRSKYRRVDEM